MIILFVIDQSLIQEGLVLRVIFDVLEQRQGLSVEQQQELGQVGAPQGQAGFQHEHLGTTRDVN